MPKPHKQLKSSYIAEPSEVRISRDADYAYITYLEPGIQSGGIRLTEEIASFSDEEILQLHNEVLRTQNQLASAHAGKPLLEVPNGLPQTEIYAHTQIRTLVGDILRCRVSEDEDFDCEVPSFIIDDQEYSLAEFGELLRTRAGWGMRIAFVEEDDLLQQPRIRVHQPETEK